jgi:type VI secretion system protein ImpH
VTTQLSEQYSFFQLVRLLERSNPHGAKVGQLGPVENEIVRFRNDTRFVFSTSDISSVETNGERTTITTAFLGLTGTTTPLSLCLAEDIVRSDDSEGGNLAAFYDFFHHRVHSLLYRTWSKYRPMSQYEPGGTDHFTHRALCLLGVASGSPVARGALPSFVQLSLAPILVGRVRSARTLELVLKRVFPGVKISIRPFVEHQVVFDKSERIQLGRHHTTITRDFTIGRTVRDHSGRFRIRIGPVTLATSERFRPGGEDFPRLRGLVEHFTRNVLEAEVEIVLDASASPRFRLGSTIGARLGETTRLCHQVKGQNMWRFLLSEEVTDIRASIFSVDEDPEVTETSFGQHGLL